MLQFIVKILKSLNSNSHPGEIAHAVCCGMILGFLPKDNALWYILTVFFVFLRINKVFFVLSTLAFSLLTLLLDPLFDQFWYFLLNIDFAKPVFDSLLEVPFVGFTKFNNTIVFGSLSSALILYIPMYWICRFVLKEWRTYLLPIVRKTKLVKIVSKIPLVKKIGDLYE